MRAGSPIKNKLWDFFNWYLSFHERTGSIKKRDKSFLLRFHQIFGDTQKQLLFRQRTYKHIHTRQPIHHSTHTNKYNTRTHTNKHNTYTNMILQTHTHICSKCTLHSHAHIYIYTTHYTQPKGAHSRTHSTQRVNLYICVYVSAYIYLNIWVCKRALICMFSEKPRTWKPWLETSRLYAWRVLISELNVVADVTHVHRIIVIISLYLLKDSCGRRGAAHWIPVLLASPLPVTLSALNWVQERSTSRQKQVLFSSTTVKVYQVHFFLNDSLKLRARWYSLNISRSESKSSP